MEKVLIVIGRRPNTEDIGLDKIGLQVDQKDFAKVNEKILMSYRWRFTPIRD